MGLPEPSLWGMAINLVEVESFPDSVSLLLVPQTPESERASDELLWMGPVAWDSMARFWEVRV